MKPISSNAIFHVSNIEESLDFYTKIIGFDIDFTFAEPIVYAGLKFGNECLHLSSQYPYNDNKGHGSIYIVFESVDELYEKFVKKELEFLAHIEDREYGMRDFAIKDLDGNQIGFGAPLIQEV